MVRHLGLPNPATRARATMMVTTTKVRIKADLARPPILAPTTTQRMMGIKAGLRRRVSRALQMATIIRTKVRPTTHGLAISNHRTNSLATKARQAIHALAISSSSLAIRVRQAIHALATIAVVAVAGVAEALVVVEARAAEEVAAAAAEDLRVNLLLVSLSPTQA
jgi:hypothetical protein